jgi:alcohol dehydrogenase
LARRLEELAETGGLRGNLRAAGVKETELPELAADAAEQWTGTFNPRPFDKQGAIEVYQCVY